MADVRGVRVARLVGERVVLAVVGYPLCDRPLHRHAAEDGERGRDRARGREALVGEVAVEADRRAERTDDVQPTSRNTSTQWKATPQSTPIAENSAERRNHDRDERHELADSARAWANGAGEQCGFHVEAG